METVITTSIYAWMAFCAVSHVRIEAKKQNKDMAFKSLCLLYCIQIAIYWGLAAVFI